MERGSNQSYSYLTLLSCCAVTSRTTLGQRLQHAALLGAVPRPAVPRCHTECCAAPRLVLIGPSYDVTERDATRQSVCTQGAVHPPPLPPFFSRQPLLPRLASMPFASLSYLSPSLFPCCCVSLPVALSHRDTHTMTSPSPSPPRGPPSRMNLSVFHGH